MAKKYQAKLREEYQEIILLSKDPTNEQLGQPEGDVWIGVEDSGGDLVLTPERNDAELGEFIVVKDEMATVNLDQCV